MPRPPRSKTHSAKLQNVSMFFSLKRHGSCFKGLAGNVYYTENWIVTGQCSRLDPQHRGACASREEFGNLPCGRNTPSPLLAAMQSG